MVCKGKAWDLAAGTCGGRGRDHQSATAYMGLDIHSALEKAELKDRDFLPRKKAEIWAGNRNQPTYACKVHTERV